MLRNRLVLATVSCLAVAPLFVGCAQADKTNPSSATTPGVSKGVPTASAIGTYTPEPAPSSNGLLGMIKQASLPDFAAWSWPSASYFTQVQTIPGAPTQLVSLCQAVPVASKSGSSLMSSSTTLTRVPEAAQAIAESYPDEASAQQAYDQLLADIKSACSTQAKDPNVTEHELTVNGIDKAVWQKITYGAKDDERRADTTMLAVLKVKNRVEAITVNSPNEGGKLPDETAFTTFVTQAATRLSK